MAEMPKVISPTYKQFAKEVLGGLEFDSLDLVEALAAMTDVKAEEFEAGQLKLTNRQQRMIFLEYMLNIGEKVEVTMFGLPVTIYPVQTGLEGGFEGPDVPDGGDDEGPNSGDREPLNPILPAGSQQISTAENYKLLRELLDAPR